MREIEVVIHTTGASRTIRLPDNSRVQTALRKAGIPVNSTSGRLVAIKHTNPKSFQNTVDTFESLR